MTMMNRLHNATNPHQGNIRKVLCVCSAGLLRSPTMAWVLSQRPWEYNTRAAGINPDFALIPVDQVLLRWADDIVVAEQWMAEQLREKTNTPVHCLNVPDNFGYRDPELVEFLTDALSGVFRVRTNAPD